MIDFRRRPTPIPAGPATTAMSYSRLTSLAKALSVSTLLAVQALPAELLHWSFTELPADSRVHGEPTRQAGPWGPCLILDGFTDYLETAMTPADSLAGGFTLEAWIAVGAYPWTQAPLLDCSDDKGKGFALSVNAHGRPILSGGLNELKGSEPLSLNRWHHLAATWSADGTRTLYVNAQPVASDKGGAGLRLPEHLSGLVGRSRTPAKPEGALRPEANALFHSHLDGALDELILSQGCLSAAELRTHYEESRPQQDTAVLPARILPAGPAGAGPFGAYHTALSFYPAWDRSWRTGPHADVVVRFDQNPGRLVFWKGTSYIPHWVTENGIWYTNEFNETWGGIKGCGEPMSDKQCRYSRVSVIESGPARAVVHWRYALTDVFYEIARADPDTGWGDWSDEVYTIYPDGTAVRDITLHSSQPDEPHEWHEGILVMGPGKRPEDCLEPGGLTVLQTDGRHHTFDWSRETPAHDPGPAQGACVYVVNTRSQLRPFMLVRPQDRPSYNLFSKEVRREVSMYPWWNHWPASQGASDGRYAFAADRPSHASLHNIAWNALEKAPRSERRVMLTGLTQETPEALLPLLKSWANPPVLTHARPGQPGSSASFDPAAKSYVLHTTGATEMEIKITASSESPLINPCLELKGWDRLPSKIQLNGQVLEMGKGYRAQLRQGLQGSDLLLWLPLKASTPVSLHLNP